MIRNLPMVLFGVATFFITWAILAWLFPILAADLPIPKPRPPVEECVSPDTHPSRRQQITSDATCPSGYRWTNTTH